VAPKRRLRPSPVGLAIVAWNVWQRLSPKQRKQLLKVARTHGPKVAARVVKATRAARTKR
jgi:hypothetical protein